MLIEEIQNLAEEMAEHYNPESISPFPYEKIEKDKKDVIIFLSDELPEDASGGIMFQQEKGVFAIFINKKKSEVRRHFTIAHELGHYFLHPDKIKEQLFIDTENVLDISNALFLRDKVEETRLEREANNFAFSLIMPSELVKGAWKKFGDVEKCARVFNVSAEAMILRLSRLKLTE